MPPSVSSLVLRWSQASTLRTTSGDGAFAAEFSPHCRIVLDVTKMPRAASIS